ncbi:Uncharacterised protein [Pasteurella canis]|uniref:HNH domain-containing protein n=1 Tax=Pasteurella canis TaxID=753 RepID=A0A379EVV2_9PAST|nr:HNH endonuclease signature motif containing protein [Pasteurella canis]SUC10274.1 Uncharacterised protein [Pasteurella canis]
MIKLNLSQDFHYSKIIDSCYDSMKSTSPLKLKVLANKDALLRVADFYEKYAKTNNLFKHNLFFLNNNDFIKIAGNTAKDLLTNYDMRELYDYFRDRRCGGFYDELINNAKNPKIKCPYCGGIGMPMELDHFLPKSKLGYYSILPYNLIPSCKDCNQSYKSTFIPENKNEQLIHPYLDDNCFFEEQWLFAQCHLDNDNVIHINYYVSPPNNWREDKKSKVKFHFDKFKLDKRFSIEASNNLSEITNELKHHKKKNKPISEFISDNLDIKLETYSHRKNHWALALYQAIKNDINILFNNLKI